MWSTDIWFGVSLGILLILGFEWLLFLRWLAYKRKARLSGTNKPIYSIHEDNVDNVTESNRTNIPESIRRVLEQYLSNRPESVLIGKEDCVWLNILVTRYFVELRKSVPLKQRLMKRLLEKLAKKLEKSGLVRSINVEDLSLGDVAPIIHSVRICEVDTWTLGTELELEVTYSGGIKVAVNTVLIVDISIPVTIYCHGLVGKLRIQCPIPGRPKDFSVSFTPDTDFQLEVQSSLRTKRSDLFKDRLNALILKKVKGLIIDYWILPNRKGFYLPLLRESRSDAIPMTLSSNNDADSQSNASKRLEPEVSQYASQRDTREKISGFSSISQTQRSDLISPFSSYENMESETLVYINDILLDRSSDWKIIKNKNSVMMQRKKRTMTNGISALMETDIYRGIAIVDCPSDVCNLLIGNPDHRRQVEPEYAQSELISRIDSERCLWKIESVIGKKTKIEELFYELKKEITDRIGLMFTPQPHDARRDGTEGKETFSHDYDLNTKFKKRFLLMYRAVLDKATQDSISKFCMYAYYIKPSLDNDNRTVLVALAQFGSKESKPVFSWRRLVRLKIFLEKMASMVSWRERHLYDEQLSNSLLSNAKEKCSSLYTNENLSEDAEEDNDSDSISRVDDSIKLEDVLDDDFFRNHASLRKRGNFSRSLLSADKKPKDQWMASSFDSVNDNNYNELVESTLTYFLALLSTAENSIWVVVKEKGRNSSCILQKRATNGNVFQPDIWKASASIAYKPKEVYDVLVSSRSSRILHPDLILSENLETLDANTTICVYIFKNGPLVPARRYILIEYADHLETDSNQPDTYILLSRTIRVPLHDRPEELEKMRIVDADVYIQGFLIESNEEKGCNITYISQIDYKSFRIENTMRFAIAEYLPRVISVLEQVLSEGSRDVQNNLSLEDRFARVSNRMSMEVGRTSLYNARSAISRLFKI